MLEIISIIESIYLFYMFFIFKTQYSFSSALFDEGVNKMGAFFVHNAGPKICMFGKIMAIVAISLAFVRVLVARCCPDYKNILIWGTIAFDITCIILALLMNMNAFMYIGPLIISEIYLVTLLKNSG